MTVQPLTVEGFMALNPAQRLRFAQELGTVVTPEIVALLVHTYLNTQMNPAIRPLYGDQLKALIRQVGPLELFVLAYRFIDTANASPSLLAAHQEISAVFSELQGNAKVSYIRQENNEYFTGTRSRRIVPANLSKLLAKGMEVDDCVLYNEARVAWSIPHRRGTVYMVLVPINDALPPTLGLAAASA